MKLNKLVILCTAVLSGTFLNAADGNSDWKFQVNLNYISGMSDLTDAYESRGYETDWEIPFGVSFAASQEYTSGFGWDMKIGPIILIMGDVDATLIPLGTGVKYGFAPQSDVNPYVRAGVQYTYVDGDYLGDSEFGFNGTVGIEFKVNKAISWGFEASYDSTEIEFASWSISKIKPYEFCLGVFVKF